MAEENENWLMRWAQFPTLWTKIKSLVSAAVSTEATRAKGVEDSLSGSIKTLVDTISAEVERAKTAEATKADKETTYTKTETDNLLTKKANSVDVYTKTEANDLLADKATVTDLQTEAKARADKDYALEDAINTQAATTATKLAEVLQSAKDYADAKASGAMQYKGSKTLAEIQALENKQNGWFWTVSDKGNKEYAYYDGKLFDIGADVDFSAMQEDINSRAKQSDLTTEVNRAKAAEKSNADAIATKANSADVYTKTQSDGRYLRSIANASITTDKLADNAVTTGKIADGNVTEVKLASALATKINGKADANYITDEMINGLS